MSELKNCILFSLIVVASSVTGFGEGEMVVVGDTLTYSNGGYDMLVYRLDSDGVKLWRKNFGGEQHDRARSVAVCADGGYLIAGSSYTYSQGNYDFLIYRITDAGVKQWRKNHGGNGWDYLSTSLQTADGGYVLFGDTNSFSNGGNDLLLYRLDAAGDVQWRKNYGGLGDEAVYRSYDQTGDGIQQTADGGYIFCGSTNTYSHGGYDFLLYKVDSAGNKQWRKNLGGDADDYAFAVCQTADGGYAVAGYSETYAYGEADFLIYRLDAAGNKLWRKNLGGDDRDHAFSMKATSDGGFIIAGRTRSSFCNGDYDFLAYKLDGFGAKMWRKHYGSHDYDRGEHIVQTADGGYIFVGFSSVYSNGDLDFLVYRLNAAGGKMWRKNFGGELDDTALCVRQ
jgi:uncharacterized delta-60 repeat protein